ncbi:MAG: calcium-binding protein [Microcoleaceae cyanobacterium]
MGSRSRGKGQPIEESINNRLYGDDSAGVIFGGADSIDGGNGNDIFLGGLGNDYLDGGAEADLIRGGAGFDLLFGGGEDGENQTAADTLTGGADADLFVLTSTGFVLEPVEPSFPPEPVLPEPVGDIVTDFQDGTDFLEYEFLGFEELIITGNGTSRVTISAVNEGVPGEGIPDYTETIVTLNGQGGSVITITEVDFLI